MGFKVLRRPDMTELWHDVVRWHLYQKKVDLYLGIGTNLNNVILEAESAEYDFDLQQVWLNRQRWTRLVREYLDPYETAAFVERSRVIFHDVGKKGVITNMHFRAVERMDRKHKWGNCLLAATFRGSPSGSVRPTLTLHSRVSYNGYVLGVDMALAHVLAREIAGDQVAGVRIQWHLDVVQLHSFKCLPYLYTQPDLMAELQAEDDRWEELIETYPTWRSIGRWWDTVRRFEAEGKPVSEEKYGPFKRIRRRYEEYQNGILVPSTHVDTLDFSKLGEEYDA